MTCVSCFMLRHLMTSWHLNIWKFKIWLSQEQKELLKWNKKHFSLFHKCSFLDIKKQTSKNLADTTFKHIPYIVLWVFIFDFKAGPQFWNPRNFWAWFSIYTTDWLKHRFLNEKELRNQMLWLGQISKINCSKKNEMGEKTKYFL